MKHALYDTEGEAWIGNDVGPLTYEDQLVARAAATVLNEMFGTVARFSAREYDEKPKRVKDSITAPISAQEAIAQLERRIR